MNSELRKIRLAPNLAQRSYRVIRGVYVYFLFVCLWCQQCVMRGRLVNTELDMEGSGRGLTRHYYSHFPGETEEKHEHKSG
jgi:hypothetical protein